jgi:hypothetical protein
MSLLKNSFQALYRMGDRDMIDNLLLHTSRKQMTEILDFMESERPTCLFCVHDGIFDFAAVNMLWLQTLKTRRKDLIGKSLAEVDLLHLGREDAFGLHGVCLQHPNHQTLTKVLTGLMPTDPDESTLTQQERVARIIAVTESRTAATGELTCLPYCADAEIRTFLKWTSETPVAFVIMLDNIQYLDPQNDSGSAKDGQEPGSPSKEIGTPQGKRSFLEKFAKRHRLRPGIEHQSNPGERIRRAVEKEHPGSNIHDLSCREQAQIIRKALDQQEFIIDPTSRWMERWDLGIMVAVLYPFLLQRQLCHL